MCTADSVLDWNTRLDFSMCSLADPDEGNESSPESTRSERNPDRLLPQVLVSRDEEYMTFDCFLNQARGVFENQDNDADCEGDPVWTTPKENRVPASGLAANTIESDLVTGHRPRFSRLASQSTKQCNHSLPDELPVACRQSSTSSHVGLPRISADPLHQSSISKSGHVPILPDSLKTYVLEKIRNAEDFTESVLPTNSPSKTASQITRSSDSIALDLPAGAKCRHHQRRGKHYKKYIKHADQYHNKIALKNFCNTKPFDSDQTEIRGEDSGYHSGPGTVAESVCSLDSVGSSFGLPKDFLQEFISCFGDMLIEKTAARAWAAVALARFTPKEFDQRMSGLLKQYSLDLTLDDVESAREQPFAPISRHGHANEAQLYRSATNLIRRYRPKISSYFRQRSSWTPLDREAMTSRLQGLGEQLSLHEKLGLFAKKDASLRGPSDHGIEDLDDVAEGSNISEMEYKDLELIKDSLVAGNAFRKLASSLRHLYYDGSSAMNQIREQLTTGLSSIFSSCQCCLPLRTSLDACMNHELVYNIKIDIHWKLKTFLRSQFNTTQSSIGSFVVLAGSALYAQAATYSDYLNSVWPISGPRFLESLQAATRNDTNDRSALARTSEADDVVTFRLSNDIQVTDTCFISGTMEFLIETAQILAFTGTIFNTSPYGEKLAYCQAEVRLNARDFSCFEMRFRSDPLHPSEDCCWLSLFCGASIARDFPIPERGDELGLEISVETMAAIGGVRHAVEYQGSVVIKGFSSMFVPIKKEESRVQWHLITSGDHDTRLSYHEVLQRCPKRATLDCVSLDNLRTTRAILGWCSTAWSALGCSISEYDNIDYSTARQSTSSVKLNGGSFGFQQFGLAQFDFSLGAKDGKCHFQRTGGPYRRIVSAAERTPIALYDTSEKRAWLVSATEVILHMVHHKHQLESFEVDGQPIKLPTTDPLHTTAKKVLLENADMDLADTETYKLKDMITSIWSLLEFLVDQRLCHVQDPGVKPHLITQDVVHGFEFKAVVQDRSPFRPKETLISKTSGGWPTLVKDIDALVLFASGFGDIIRPVTDHASNRGLCHMWSTVPKEKDYLCTSVNTLIDLYDTAGYRLDRTFLTSTHLQWHRGTSTLFDPCTTPGRYICKCNRLQQVVARSAVGHVTKPGPLTENGAVIFGQSGSPFRELGSISNDTKTYGIYDQPNATFEFSSSTLDDAVEPASSIGSTCDAIDHNSTDGTDGTVTSWTPYSTDRSRGSIDGAIKTEDYFNHKNHEDHLKAPTPHGICMQAEGERLSERSCSDTQTDHVCSGLALVISSSSSTSQQTQCKLEHL